MCNGFSTRKTQGGAMALLQQPIARSGEVGYRIVLHRTEDLLRIKFSLADASYRLEDARTRWPDELDLAAVDKLMDLIDMNGATLEIHRDGNLVASEERDSKPPLYSFKLPPGLLPSYVFRELPTSKKRLPTIDSNEEIGVIGRRISLKTVSGMPWFEGIVGWN